MGGAGSINISPKTIQHYASSQGYSMPQHQQQQSPVASVGQPPIVANPSTNSQATAATSPWNAPVYQAAQSPIFAGGGSIAPNPIFNPFGINYYQQPGGTLPGGSYQSTGGFNPNPLTAFYESQQTGSGNPLAGYGLLNPMTGGTLSQAWMQPNFYFPTSYGTPANNTFNQTYNPWLSLMIPNYQSGGYA